MRSAGARPRRSSASRWKSCRATGGARCARPSVEERLRADKAGAIKAILVAHIDTASGVVNDIAAIGKAIKAARHDALFMVDAVASLGCVPFEMDAWGIDVAMSGSQKGLMSPPGLGFVAVGPRAREAHAKAGLRTPYWDWTARDGDLHYQKYAGTPPEHLMFAVRQAFDMLFAEGLENVFVRHRLLAEAVRRAVAVWSEGQAFSFNIAEAAERSDTVTTVLMDEGDDPRALFDYCNSKCGVVLGIGIGDAVGQGVPHRPYGPRQRPDACSAFSASSKSRSMRSASRTAKAAVQAAIEWLGASVKA